MEHAKHDYALAGLDPEVLALCDFAIKLTRAPSAMTVADADELRSHGGNDVAIHDAIQVVPYFNYINRVAEAVGIDDEPTGLDQARLSVGNQLRPPPVS